MYHRVQRFILIPILTEFNDQGEPVAEVQVKSKMYFLANGPNLNSIATEIENEASAQIKKAQITGRFGNKSDSR